MPRAAILLALSSLGLAACSRPTQTTLALAPGQYPAAFEAAKHVLRDEHFDVERVDAHAGIITSAPHHSAGLGTLWDSQQSSLGDEIEDLVHDQRRTVRITFEPPATPVASAARPTGTDDLTEQTGPVTMRVRVIQDRIQRPGWRIGTASIRLSTRASDPEMARRQMQPRYDVAISEDRALAARITHGISRRLAARESETQPAPDQR